MKKVGVERTLPHYMGHPAQLGLVGVQCDFRIARV